MDGTLVYFKIDWLKTRKEAIRVLEENGIPKGRYSVKKAIRENLNDAKNYMKEVLKYSDEQIAEIVQLINEAIIKIEMRAAKKAKAVKGVQKLLQFAKKLGLKQIICTYNSHDTAKVTLESAGINEYFDGIFGRDDVLAPKPDEIHIKTAADTFSIAPNECIMIGDHAIDIEMAKSFGCEAIGIKRNGKYSNNDFDKADYIVHQSKMSDKIINIIKQKMNP